MKPNSIQTPELITEAIAGYMRFTLLGAITKLNIDFSKAVLRSLGPCNHVGAFSHYAAYSAYAQHRA